MVYVFIGALVLGLVLIATGVVSKIRAKKRLQAEYEAETSGAGVDEDER